MNKKSLYDAIEAQVAGENRKLLKGIIFVVITPAQRLAKKCLKSIKGLGRDNNIYNLNFFRVRFTKICPKGLFESSSKSFFIMLLFSMK